MTEQPLKNLTSRQINETIRYTSWAVYRRNAALTDEKSASAQFVDLVNKAAEQDVQLRGVYDVSGMRADADLIFWFHAPKAEMIQSTLRDLRRTALGSSLAPTWSAMALHRPAEFNKGHVPAFMTGAGAKDWLSVYPFVRSYEWYLLPDEERRNLLMEHGIAGRDFTGMLSNTVASFALGDYEWILALESNDLYEIVDMMRHLRSTKARLHVREEIPFFTGRRVEPEKVAGLIA